jgi:hypothetical protein
LCLSTRWTRGPLRLPPPPCCLWRQVSTASKEVKCHWHLIRVDKDLTRVVWLCIYSLNNLCQI